MRVLVASILLVAASVALTGVVGAAAPQDRPPGVAAVDWVPVSSSAGLVLAHPRPAPPKHDCPCYKNGLCGSCNPPMPVPDRTALLMGSADRVEGYFMLKRGGVWHRLVIVDPASGPRAAG